MIIWLWVVAAVLNCRRQRKKSNERLGTRSLLHCDSHILARYFYSLYKMRSERKGILANLAALVYYSLDFCHLWRVEQLVYLLRDENLGKGSSDSSSVYQHFLQVRMSFWCYFFSLRIIAFILFTVHKYFTFLQQKYLIILKLFR